MTADKIAKTTASNKSVSKATSFRRLIPRPIDVCHVVHRLWLYLLINLVISYSILHVPLCVLSVKHMITWWHMDLIWRVVFMHVSQLLLVSWDTRPGPVMLSWRHLSWNHRGSLMLSVVETWNSSESEWKMTSHGFKWNQSILSSRNLGSHLSELWSTSHGTCYCFWFEYSLAALSIFCSKNRSNPQVTRLKNKLRPSSGALRIHSMWHQKFCPSLVFCFCLFFIFPQSSLFGLPLCCGEKTPISDTIWQKMAKALWTPPSLNSSICWGIWLFVVSH